MNSPHPPLPPHRARWPRRPPWAALALLPVLVATASPPVRMTIESRPSPERNYRLFVGVDVKVLHQDDFTPVADFANHTAVLAGDTRARIPTHLIDRIRFDHATKIARASIRLDAITTDRDYSAGANPRWTQMQAQAAVQAQREDRLSTLQRGITIAAGTPQSAAVTLPDGTTVSDNSLAKAVAEYSNFANASSKQADTAYFVGQASADAADDAFDSIVVRTTVSAPQPIVDAYIVGVARIRVDDALSDVIFFHEVAEIGPEPREIRMRKDGLPPGFEVDSVVLHVYRQGQELVTDQSEKQFALTRDEALEYLTLERLSSHRGETLPASPAWSLAPDALLASRNPEEFDLPMTVQVDERGRVLAIDTPARVPPRIADVATEVVFLPAIENGVAVAGTARLNLRDFFR